MLNGPAHRVSLVEGRHRHPYGAMLESETMGQTLPKGTFLLP